MSERDDDDDSGGSDNGDDNGNGNGTAQVAGHRQRVARVGAAQPGARPRPVESRRVG